MFYIALLVVIGSTTSVGEERAHYFCFRLLVILWILFKVEFLFLLVLRTGRVIHCGTLWLFIRLFSMGHRGLNLYKFYINDD